MLGGVVGGPPGAAFRNVNVPNAVLLELKTEEKCSREERNSRKRNAMNQIGQIHPGNVLVVFMCGAARSLQRH